MSGSTQGAGCDRQKLWPGLAKYIFLVSGLDWTLLSVLEVVLICSCSRGCLGSLLPPSLPSPTQPGHQVLTSAGSSCSQRGSAESPVACGCCGGRLSSQPAFPWEPGRPFPTPSESLPQCWGHGLNWLGPEQKQCVPT